MAWIAVIPFVVGAVMLLCGDAVWSLHAWGKRTQGIVGLERTREWDGMRKIGGTIAMVLSVVMFFSISHFQKEWSKGMRGHARIHRLEFPRTPEGETQRDHGVDRKIREWSDPPGNK